MKPPSCARAVTAALLLLACIEMNAAVIGTSSPAPPLRTDRLHDLSADQRGEWVDYLLRSQVRMAADKATLAAERAALTGQIPAPPTTGGGTASMPLNMATTWYGSSEARLVADNIVSFQTPSGGWGKNQPRNAPPRLPGQWYVAVSPAVQRQPRDPAWAYVGTIDNDATVTEIRFLAKVADQAPAASAEVYRRSVLRGLNYLLEAQFPNGGWPQVWPLQGGYHDALTLNDGAMVNVAGLLGEAAGAVDVWSFLPASLQAAAARAERRAIDALLKLQLAIDGHKTLWAQQYDALTLAPSSARNYEPAAFASAESAAVLVYLMSLNTDDKKIAAAVDAGIATLRKLAIEDMAWRAVSESDGRRLVPQAGARTLWSRYYDLTTLKPIFGDRDASVHDDVNELSAERRNGYAWFGSNPAKAISAHAGWRARRK